MIGDLAGSLATWVHREEREAQVMWAREEWWARLGRRETKGLEDQEGSGEFQGPKESLAL